MCTKRAKLTCVTTTVERRVFISPVPVIASTKHNFTIRAGAGAAGVGVANVFISYFNP
jgi:hypothetical protein